MIPAANSAPISAGASLRGPLGEEAGGSPGVTFADPATVEIDALAFVTDPRSEQALREGLSDLHDAQVWIGDLRAAATALGEGHSARLVFVDIDEIPYPAGALYELSSVCAVGTIVIALGSDDTARCCREILLAGVSDYLVKPITAAAVRECAARAAGTIALDSLDGRLVGFTGTGGSGATTLAAATALLAASRGRYVSVLDLNRMAPALSIALDVEPAGGLVDLLSTVARASLHSEMVDSMRATRSDRIAVFGYPSSAVPAPLAPVWAVCELLVELQRRSHLVIVDGMDDPAARQALLAIFDMRVLVVEPTTTGAAAMARMLARLGPMRGPDWPMVLVQNHTRDFKARASTRALRRSGIAGAPDVLIPFEPALPAIADRGWPQGRIPRALREPLAKLVDRCLITSSGEARAAPVRDADTARAASPVSPARSDRSRTPQGPVAAARPSRVRSMLRQLLPPRTARPRTA